MILITWGLCPLSLKIWCNDVNFLSYVTFGANSRKNYTYYIFQCNYRKFEASFSQIFHSSEPKRQMLKILFTRRLKMDTWNSWRNVCSRSRVTHINMLNITKFTRDRSNNIMKIDNSLGFVIFLCKVKYSCLFI